MRAASHDLRKAVNSILLFCFSLAVAFPAVLLFPNAANAQVDSIGGPVVVSVMAPQQTKNSIMDEITIGLVEGLSTAVVSAGNYFAQQFATMLAQNILNCAGQKPCFDSKEFSKGMKDAALGAAGEAIGSFSEASGLTGLGLNLCAPNVNMTLNIQLGLLDQMKPPTPKCDLSKIANNWKAAANQFKPSEMMKTLKNSFKPGQSPLSAGLQMGNVVKLEVQPKAYAEKGMKTLNSYAGGGGFLGVQDPVTGNVLSPAAVTKSEFDAYKKKGGAQQELGTQIATGANIAAKAWKPIIGSFVQTFAMTLLKGLWNMGVEKLLSLMAADEAASEISLLDRNALVNPGALETSQKITEKMPSLSSQSAPIKSSGVMDMVSMFGLCPETYRSPNNCVMDQNLSVAIRSANAISLSVGEALSKGILNRDFPLIPATSQLNSKPSCYQSGYCESNLKKMRAARILPIGWEIAASKVAASGEKVTLGQVVDNFTNCNNQGLPDAEHKWCHLIDPSWVLKAPSAECRAMVYGQTLLSPDIPTRAQTCVDVATCLREDDFGQCVGGFGYCTQERRVWRFNGDSCPEQYNSCRSFKDASGKTVNYLLNTLDYGVCNSSNDGCQAFSTQLNAMSCSSASVCSSNEGCACTVKFSCDIKQGNRSCLTPRGERCSQASTCSSAVCPCEISSSCTIAAGAQTCSTIVGGPDPGDDWQKTPARYFNRQAEGCTAENNGCTALLKLPASAALNLVRNGSFEVREDGDVDGAYDHAKFWSPFGKMSDNGPASAVTGSDADGKFYASSGQTAFRVGGTYSSTCSLSAPCENYPACTCSKSGYGCQVAKGDTSCTVTDRLVQDHLPLLPNRTYTLSAAFRKIPAALTPGSGTVSGSLRLKFYNPDFGQVIDSNSGWTSASVAYTPGVGSCSFGATSGLSLSLDAAALANDTAYVRANCSFQVLKPVVGAFLEITGAQTMVDEVMLVEGGATGFHDEYGEIETMLYAKIPPAYFGCTGEDGDPEQCRSFAAVCRDNEVGCDRYTPTKSADPAIPGIAGPQDACPAECAGYDVFKQEASEFERTAKFPVYFIPGASLSCSDADIGCSEFTDIETEQRNYYSRLRVCQKLDANTNQVFYSWEGSDTAGYQLKVWNLKRTEEPVDKPGADSDVCSPTAGADCGYSPCVHLNAAAPVGDDQFACLDDSVTLGGAPLPDGFCTRDSIDTGHDYDCREFYDEFGNRHYRLMSRVIVAASDCRRYRITGSTATDCRDSNGVWNSEKEECIYAASASDSQSCAEAAKGCRAYKGNAASNVRSVFNDEFEGSLNTAVWQAWNTDTVAQSTESLIVGGHSMKISGTSATLRTAYLKLGSLLDEGQSYSLSFWARGSGELDIKFGSDTGSSSQDFSDGDDATKSVPKILLTSEWRRYSLGPVIFKPVADNYPGCEQGRCMVLAAVKPAGGSLGEVYVDNFILNEVRDTISVVRDSWQIPASCDQTADGASSPREMLGCREYKNSADKVSYLRSFSKLCREKAIGCSAYSDTKNTPEAPYEQSFNAVCRLSGKCGTEVSADGGTNCICNYHIASAAAESGAPDVVTDVCRVAFNETECRFNLEDRASLDTRAAYPDIASIPADSLTYLVVNKKDTCDSSNMGCRAVGMPSLVYDGTCSISGTCEPAAGAADQTCPCTDAKTGGFCRVKKGEASCPFAISDPIYEKWRAVAVKDLPAKYPQTLCLEKEVGCSQYTSRDGSYFFKDPGSRSCEYKENVIVNDLKVSGWFRKTASNAVLPCYGELLKSGELYAIYKNKDQRCDLKTPCTADKGCACYMSTNPSSPTCALSASCDKAGGCACPSEELPTCNVPNGQTTCKAPQACKVMKGNSVCGFDGWVGVCEARFDRCEEFVDTVATSASNPAGKAYYYIFNTKTDTQTCAGKVDLKAGCVAFNQTSNPQSLYSAAASYLKAGTGSGAPVNCNLSGRASFCEKRCFSYSNGVCADPALQGKACTQDSDCGSGVGGCFGIENFSYGCSSDSDCNAQSGEKCVSYGTPGSCPAGQTCRLSNRGIDFTRNDSNIVIKVRPDRECARWLSCRESEVSWDENRGEWRETCTGFGLCEEAGTAGSSSDCKTYNEPARVRLTDTEYAKRDISWKGLEYSGFSLPGTYPAQYLVPVTFTEGTCMGDDSNGIAGKVCTTQADCGSKAWCSLTEMAKQRYGINLELCSGGSRSGQLCVENGDCIGGGKCVTTCKQDTDCVDQITDTQFGASGKGGKCYQHRCYYALTGGPLERDNTRAMPMCRAYPEADSPFPSTVILAGQGGYDNYGVAAGQGSERSPEFKGANVCLKGQDCECAYLKLSYGALSSNARYVSPGGMPANALSLCSGGNYDGAYCAASGAGTVTKATCTTTGNGQCQVLKSLARVFGLPGFCLDYDDSTRINNDNTLRSCILWLPVDKMSGMVDRFNQFTEAAWTPPDGLQEINYCQVATGNVTGDGDYVVQNIYSENKEGDDIAPDACVSKGWCAQGISYDSEGNRSCDGRRGSNNTDDSKNEACTNDCVDQITYDASWPHDDATFSGGTACQQWSQKVFNTKCKDAMAITGALTGAFTFGLGGVAGAASAGAACYMYLQNECNSSSMTTCKSSGVAFNQSSKWFKVSWEDFHRQTWDASSLQIMQDNVAGIKIRLENGGAFYLSRTNEWTNHLLWGGNDSPTLNDPQQGGNDEWIGDGNNGPCVRAINSEGDCEGIEDDSKNNCLMARAEWEDVGGGRLKLKQFRTNLCHNASTISHHVQVNGVDVLLRENCTQLVNVYDAARNDAAGLPLTDAIYQAGKANSSLSGVPYTYASTRPGLPDGGAMTPFGRLAPPEGTYVNDARQLPLPVYESDGGSPYILYAPETNPSDPSQTVWNPAAHTGQGPYTNLGDTAVAAGYPYACVNACAGRDASMGNASNAARAALKTMFARSWKAWNWDYPSGSYLDSPASAWDFRLTIVTSADRVPKVFGVDSSVGHCKFGEEGNCVETGAGLTLVKSGTATESNGSGVGPTDLVEDNAGRLAVRIRYYAAADKDQLPLRHMIFDYGDGKIMDSGLAFYKNHRGATDPSPATANATVRANNLVKICASADTWGLTDDSCDSRYFEQAKTYVCTVPYAESLPECGTGDKEVYPCRDNQGKCNFRPRVQFTDNWGFCNGVCTNRTGSLCYNPELDFNADEPQNTCTLAMMDYKSNLTPTVYSPWTWSFGKIIIAPH